jgi:hypothetical protein
MTQQIICNSEGMLFDSTLDPEISEEVVSYVTPLIRKSRQIVDVLEEGDLNIIRLETAKNIEIRVTLEENLVIISLRSKEGDYGDEGDLPLPYIFQPPTPPGDLGLAGEPQIKAPDTRQIIEYEPYCKHCGAELPEGQTICHVCGKKVM